MACTYVPKTCFSSYFEWNKVKLKITFMVMLSASKVNVLRGQGVLWVQITENEFECPADLERVTIGHFAERFVNKNNSKLA